MNETVAEMIAVDIAREQNVGMDEAKEMMEDKELKELAEMEYYDNKEKLPKLEEELKFANPKRSR